MKTALRWGLAPACVLALASAATADPITDLYDTGVITNGVLAPGGALDLHYSLVSAPGGFTNAFVSSNIPSSYEANGPTSQWIGPDPNLDQTFPGSPPIYDYRTTFSLGAGLDPSTATISGSFSSDDGVEIYLNGADTGVGLAGFNGSLVAFSLPAGGNFLGGTNVLDFVVSNSGGGPTGLRVDGIAGSANAVPEPASLTLTGLGLLSLGRFARRRRKAPRSA